MHFVIFVAYIWGSGGLLEASWSHLGSVYAKRMQNARLISFFEEAILRYFWNQIVFSCICFASLLMLVFGIVFGKPLAFILMMWVSFQGAFGRSFANLSADAKKFKKCNLSERNAWFGRCWAYLFAWFFLSF